MSVRKRLSSSIGPNHSGISDDDIYLMVCLHRYQKKSCEQIARRFGLTAGVVKDIIGRRSNSGCCG